jgi:orotidine-5'-phosphate decarboxylase
MSFHERLLDAIDQKNAPICVGIDPIYDQLPADLKTSDQPTPAEIIDAYFDFTMGVLEAVAPLVPVVKFQSAYFEQYHAEGVEAYYNLIAEARGMGLLTIGDVKRGDIGSTSTAYAHAHLAEIDRGDDVAESIRDDILDHGETPDAITINPMLGIDAIEPFVQRADATGKGLFILVRTSNPGSADFQDVKLENGLTWSEHLADTLQKRVVKPRIGRGRYTSIGAVVGATQTHTMKSLRGRLPNSILLLPGYGTQGATADMTRAAFDGNGRGAIVSASRSVLYSKAASGESWQSAIRRAATTMRDEIRQVIA